jgi:hypothetical protein
MMWVAAWELPFKNQIVRTYNQNQPLTTVRVTLVAE